MAYTFEILGVSPILYFFNQQQEVIQTKPQIAVEYLSSYQCTLDALLESAESVGCKHGWDLEGVVQTMIDFWVKNSDTVRYWKSRLEDAGKENLLVSRVADMKGLQTEFELLLNKKV